MFDLAPQRSPLWSRLLIGAATAVFLGLAAVGVAALFRPGSYARWVQQGADALDRGSPREAIRLLDQAERAAPPSRPVDLLRRIYDVRARAHLLVGNLGFAERDLRAELDLPLPRPEKEGLQVRLARLVHLPRSDHFLAEREFAAAEGEIQQALRVVRPLTEEGEAEALQEARETAGEACQRAYQLTVVRIQEALRAHLAEKAQREANRLLLELLFQGESDPVYRLNRDKLESLLVAADVPGSRRSWVEEQLLAARAWVAEAFRHYGRALGPVRAFSAFQGISGLLVQSGRPVEAALICRRLLDQGGSPFLGRAAERLAEIYQRAGQEDRALAVLAEWTAAWPPEAMLAEFRQFPPPAQDAWILLMDLHVSRQDGPGLAGVVDRLWRHQETFGPRLQTLVPFYTGMSRALNGWEPEQMEAMLAAFVRGQAARPSGWIDRYRTAQEARIQAAAAQNRLEQAHQILTQWVEQRPWDVNARLKRAQLLTSEQREEEALLDLAQAYELERTDRILARIWELREQMLAREGRTAEATLKTLLERRNLLVKDLPHKHLHLPLARLLLAPSDSGVPQVRREAALFHASLAALAYPDSPAVQVLLNRARLATGRVEEARAARAALETLRSQEPNEPEVLGLLSQTYRVLEIHDADLDRDLVRWGQGHPAFRLVVRGLLARGAPEAALAGARRGLETVGPDAELSLLAAEAAARLGRKREAVTLLEAIPPDNQAWWPARERRLALLATTRSREGLPAAVTEFAAPGTPPERTLAAAETLFQAGLGAEALAVARSLAEGGEERAQGRNGRLYTLLAWCLLQAGREPEAIRSAEKALGFPDGQEALGFLVPLYLVRGRQEDARETLALVDAPRLFAPLDRATLNALAGEREVARELAANLLADPDPWHRAATASLARLAGEEPPPGPRDQIDLDRLVQEDPKRLALALLLLRLGSFPRETTALAASLREAWPENPWARLLLARARLAAGHTPEALGDLAWLAGTKPRFADAWELLFRHSRNLAAELDLYQKALFYLQVLLPIWQAQVSVPGQGLSTTDLEFAAEISNLLSDWSRSLGEGLKLAPLPGSKDLAEQWLTWARVFAGLTQEILAGTGRDPLPIGAIQASLLSGDVDRAWSTLADQLDRAAGEEQSRLADAFFRASRELPSRQEAARRIAEKRLHRPEGPCGPALHFLLETDPGPLREACRARAAELAEHLKRVRSLPEESVEFLLAGSSSRLLALVDPGAGLDGARELLRRNPSHWGAWAGEAVALAGLGRQADALDTLSFPRRYLAPSPLMVDEVAARARLQATVPPVPEDLALLQGLPRGEARDFALGLALLRQGQPREAWELLHHLPPRSGEALLYEALAALSIRPGRLHDARRCLERLRQAHAGAEGRHAELVLQVLDAAER